MKLQPHSNKWLVWLGAFLIRLVGKTLRICVRDPHHFLKRENATPCIWAVWHNRILIFPFIYEHYCSSHPCSVLISQSRDGEWISAIAKHFGIESVRGSTSKGGGSAYRSLLRELIQKKNDVTITPDGPRGPRYHVQPGILLLSQMSGIPIIPITYHLKRKWELNSWDNFQIPFPFTRCDLMVHEPIHIPKDLPKEELPLWQKRITKALGD